MYSNCLFEAIKAKIKDPKNVKIYYLSSKLNITHGCHFLWTDKSSGTNDFFEFVRENKKQKQSFFFKGHISKTSRKELQRAINIKLRKNTLKIEQTFGVKIDQNEFDRREKLFRWTSICNKPDLEFFYSEIGHNVKPFILGVSFTNEKTPVYKLYDMSVENDFEKDNVAIWTWFSQGSFIEKLLEPYLFACEKSMFEQFPELESLNVPDYLSIQYDNKNK